MDYKELIGKTIFDFTKDAALIERVTKVNPSDKEKVAFYKEHCHPIGKAEDIEELAEILNDKELRNAAKRLCNELWKDFDRRASEANEKGIIVD